MATSGTYYLDAPSLGSATVIYSDINLTTIAPDGFYSDGVIVREQALGVLLPQVTCGSCIPTCGGTISASGAQGVYNLSFDLGTATGAVVVSFDPIGVPDGIIAQYNSTYYNGLSSPSFGWLQGSLSSLPTYIGDSLSDCGIVAGSPYVLNVYNYVGGSFVPSGGTENVTILSPQLDLTVGLPGDCKMVIPKTSASPSVLTLKFIGPCPGTVFNVGTACPAPLTSFASSTVGGSSAAACSDSIDQTYYVVHVNGSGGVLGLYDLVFSDPNGEFKLPAGYYRTSAAGANDWFQVDSNGVIISFGVCPPPPPVYSYNCVDGNCVQISGSSGTYPTLQDCTNNCAAPVTSYNCVDGGCVEISGSSGTYPTLQDCIDNCGVPPVYSYNCVDGNCVQISGSSGTYPTLQDCTNNCAPPVTSYNCVEGECVQISGSSGTYATLAACESACGASYNCVDGNCVQISGNSGTYATLAACESACGTSYNCVDGNCVQISGNSGTYATLAACEAACGTTYNCVDGNCVPISGNSGTYATLAACEAACPPPCDCHDGTINDNNAFNYYDCSGNPISGGAELGSEICFDITKPFSGNITDDGPSVGCSCA
jgi:hypothetical protein